MSNIITATFDNTTVITAAPAYQHDYGQMLQIEGVDLPSTFEAHFCNEGDTVTTTQVGNDGIVTVPDAYFLNGKNILAFIYLHATPNDGETVYKIVIPIRKRQQPTHETPTPVQQSEIEQALAALELAVTESETNVTHYPQIVNDYWYVWDADTGEFINTHVKAEGIDGISPEVSISETTEGHTVTIIDAEHPSGQTFEVMDGVATVLSGFINMAVDSAGNLWAYSQDEASELFEYDPETGNLYYVMEED